MGLSPFEQVVRYITDPQVAGDFPPDLLKNRLALTGVKRLLEDGMISEAAYPFKYYHPLDEAILMLHYFLTRSVRIERSYIQIHTIHVPTKEEENTLSFWKSPKAGLYLDLHSLIENNNQRRGHPNLIKRLFVFRDNAHLAFLEAAGIGVILEQQSIGIRTGFRLASHQEPPIAHLIKAGMVLIQLFHADGKLCEWALGLDKVDAANLPYGNHLVCRWHKGQVHNSRACADAEVQVDLRDYLRLFDFENTLPARATGRESYDFVSDPSNFGELLMENFQVALRGIGAPRAHTTNYKRQFKVKTVPDTLKQFHKVVTFSKESGYIHAVDASSVRSTLRVHDADPNYRHWIRTTINWAIKGKISLERVYILDLNPGKDDYNVFGQEVMLYRDFLSNRITSLGKVWPPEEMGPPHLDAWGVPDAEPSVGSSEDEQVNIRLYVITKKAIQEFLEDPRQTYMEGFLSRLRRGGFIVNERRTNNSEAQIRLITTSMRELDFLYTEHLLFNYKDYKGEPGQAIYDADLFMRGQPTESESGVITFLDNEEFADKRRAYEELFGLFKELSVCILSPEDEGGVPPPEGGGGLLPTVEELEHELARLREKHFTDPP